MASPGTLIDARTGKTRTIAEDLRETLRELAPHAQVLGSEDAFTALLATVEQGNHAAWLRNVFTEHQTLPDVVRRQSELWAA